MSKKFAVVIPTYLRTEDLKRCVASLEAQERTPDQVVVVVRNTDTQTLEFVKQYRPKAMNFEWAEVCVTGVVAAMNTGLDAVVDADYIAVIDDDAIPPPDWSARIEKYFETYPKAGAVGGRDRVHEDGGILEGNETVVGTVTWCGKYFGNHHIGVGGLREVDVLKGVNAAYRSAALKPIGFDRRLRGTGAQTHWEMSVCLSIKRAGWIILYDPDHTLEHYTAPRKDEDQRWRKFNFLATENKSYNESIVILGHLHGIRRAAYLAYCVFVGTWEMPGILQIPRSLLRRDPDLAGRIKATIRGRRAGWKFALSEKETAPPEAVSAAPQEKAQPAGRT